MTSLNALLGKHQLFYRLINLFCYFINDSELNESTHFSSIEELSTARDETEIELAKVKDLDVANRKLEIECDKVTAALEVGEGRTRFLIA